MVGMVHALRTAGLWALFMSCMIACGDQGEGPSPIASRPMIDAATIPPTPCGGDVEEHLSRFRTGDEQRIQDVAARLAEHVDRPWTVERLAANFAAALAEQRRADLVYLLAASRDPMGMRVAGHALSHHDPSVALAAAEGIERYWIEVKEGAMGNLESMISASRSWWQRRRSAMEPGR